MRDILFRAKRKDNGEWVEGYYCSCCFGFFPCRPAIISADEIQNGCWNPEEVILETVGQYTGLTDKNGKKIFEGDILSERPPMNQTAYIGYVTYDDKSAVWRFMIKNDTRYNGVLLGSYSNSYKIIGNIHDNPELLGGDDNA